MESLKLAQSNQELQAVRLAITMGLAMLLLAALLCELREVTPAHADPDTLYVDRASGSDTTACANSVSPCATIGYALDQAEDFDAILVAGGTSTSVTATRITNRSAPFIDGILEDIWQDAGTVTFPNSDGGCFTIDYQHYGDTNPSTFTVYYLHDDINLYIAVQTTDDRMVEGSDYDQNSDGLAGMAIERKNDPDNPYSMFRLMWYTDTVSPCVSVTTGPPLDRDRMVYDAEWRSVLHGTWNDNSDSDNGYTFEFSIPLSDPVSGSTSGLGGWTAGDQIRANIVLVDHDSKPGAPYNDPEANFRKCWWGSDSAEVISPTRWIILSDDPIDQPGDDKTVTARRIISSVAPVVDGNPDEPIWQQAGKLRFPNSVGRSWTTSQARYNADDPSNYTLYFLHDDSYVYVGVKADDRKIEAAAYDQASDGLISLVFEVKDGGSDKRYSTFWHKLDVWQQVTPPVPITDCGGITKTNVCLHFHEGPPRYPSDTPHIDWGPTITGTWNENSDVDAGYAFEYKIPLTGTLSVSVTETLGGYVAGESIPANVVLIDHDNNPFYRPDAKGCLPFAVYLPLVAGGHEDCDTHFKKFWWGFDGNEFYPPDENGNPGPRRDIHPEEERYVCLDDGTPYGDDGPSLDPATKAVQYIANNQLEYSGLIRSYQGEMAAHTYDNAVALIALTDACKRSEAQKLANALISVMEANDNEGFFYDSYNVVDKIVSQGTASGTGPNAWAAYALAYYGTVYTDQNALDAADKVIQWTINKELYDPDDGGVWGGICHPFEERPGDHSGDLVFPFKSTEQVLDTWHLFRIMGYDSEAESVKSWLTSEGKGWIETDPRDGDECQQDNRFATGTNSQCGQDMRLFLDPQSWGSIFANMIGEPDKANGAIEAAENHMRVVDTVVNGQDISGFSDSCLPKDGVIWYGGTAQMIVAYVYNSDIISATYFLSEMAKVQNDDGSWNHSSAITHAQIGTGCNSYKSYHSARPHIGETAWNYFALRDVRDGQRLPYMPIIMKNRP